MLNNIHECNLHNVDAIVMLCDFRKAFDSIGHEFLLKTLKFFNFGDNFIKIIKTIITGRVGNILIDNIPNSAFDFLSGTGQGDPPSPLLFIICLEILLIRLIVDVNVEKVTIESNQTVHNLGIGQAYADDLSPILKNNIRNLNHVTEIFEEFYNLSGLNPGTPKGSF